MLLAFGTAVFFRRIVVRSIGFATGTLAGLIYFLAIPLFIVLLTGQLESPFSTADNYDPFTDLETTLVLFLGWLAVLAACVVSHRNSSQNIGRSKVTQNSITYLRVLLVLYLIFSVYALLASGIGTVGSHWHLTIATKLATSTTFIIIKNFLDAFRVMVFGLLLFTLNNNLISKRTAILIAISIATIDLATTFNRITIVFLLFFLLILLRRYWYTYLAAVASLFSVAITVSAAWPVFRGIIFSERITALSVIESWNSAVNATNFSGNQLADKLNVLFESSNIIVLKYIVDNLGNTVPYFMGSTFLVRPLTTFLPSTVWANKPRVFGTYLGEIIESHPGLALNSTLFGEVYANFGIFWILFLFGFIVVFHALYRVVGNTIPGMENMGFFIGIAVWRFEANFASVSLYAALMLWIVFRSLRILKRRRSHK